MDHGNFMKKFDLKLISLKYLCQISMSLFFLLVGPSRGLAQNRPMVRTDLDKVFQSGQVNRSSPRVELKPGLYVVGDEKHEGSGTHYLLVDVDVNNPDRLIGLMIPEDSLSKGTTSVGKFFVGRSIKGGTSVMLAPLIIDMDGNILVDSEMTRNSPVLEISAIATEGSHRYPYMIEGHNGALNGKIMGMRAAPYNRQPTWKGWPSAGIFEAESSHGKMVVRGSSISIHDGSRLDHRYSLVPLNGDLGKIAGLKESSFDTMAEMDISASKFSKIAFFLNGLCEEEIFVIASPAVRPGDYNIEFYSPKHKSVFDIFRPGRF